MAVAISFVSGNNGIDAAQVSANINSSSAVCELPRLNDSNIS